MKFWPFTNISINCKLRPALCRVQYVLKLGISILQALLLTVWKYDLPQVLSFNNSAVILILLYIVTLYWNRLFTNDLEFCSSTFWRVGCLLKITSFIPPHGKVYRVPANHVHVISSRCYRNFILISFWWNLDKLFQFHLKSPYPNLFKISWLELKDRSQPKKSFYFVKPLFENLFRHTTVLVSSRFKFQKDLITTNEAFICNSVAVV